MVGGSDLPKQREQLGEGVLEHPRSQRKDEPGLLCQGDELVGADQAALGMFPADERLEAGEGRIADDPIRFPGAGEEVADPELVRLGQPWRARIQFTLPRNVLISPLCASILNGCASHHCGNVFVL